MVIVPLMADGEVAGHAEHRPHGRRRGALLPERVRADEAVRGPGSHRPPECRGPRRGQGPGRARRAHGTPQPRRFQRELAAFLAVSETRAGRGADDGSRPVQGLQRPQRPSGRRRPARRREPRDRVLHPRRRPRLPLRRRRVRGDPARLRPARRPRRSRAGSAPRSTRSPTTAADRTCRSASAWPAIPRTPATRTTLVETADQALFLAKGAPFRNSRDQFVAALDETAMGLLDGSARSELLDSVLIRAAAPARRPARLRLPRRARRRPPHRSRRDRRHGRRASGSGMPVDDGASAARSSAPAGRSRSTTTTRSRATRPTYDGHGRRRRRARR